MFFLKRKGTITAINKLVTYITNNAPAVILGISFVVNEKRALKEKEQGEKS